MIKETSYYTQALEFPLFLNFLLAELMMNSSEDTLEAASLKFLEQTQEDCDKDIPAKIELSA